MNGNDQAGKKVATGELKCRNAKKRSALNALCAGINHCLANRVITLDYDPKANEDGINAQVRFPLLEREAIADLYGIGHGEIMVIVAAPRNDGVIPRIPIGWNMRLGTDYDFFALGWLERKTGKFIQGEIRCQTKRKPWNRALEKATIEPEGYTFSSKFFR